MSGRLLSGDFLRLFLADTTSTLGSVVSSLALQFLLIGTLHATQDEIGLVRGAQFLPYLVLGLLGGVLADRVRRKPLLIGSDLVSMVVYAAIGVSALTGHLTIWALAALVLVAGAVTTVSVATYQSYMPSLVPRHLVGAAFAREAQMGQVMSSIGPLASGGLVRIASAPVAVIVDAVTYLVSAVLTATIRQAEPRPVTHDRHVLADLREGARWVYGHRRLRPYALALHTWFHGYAVMSTVEVHYAQRVLDLGEVTIGLALGALGVVSVVSAGLGERLSRRFGVGPVVIASAWFAPVGTLVFALAGRGSAGLVVYFLGHAIWGGSAAWSALSMAYRTVVTPDRLRARMNATIRTVNWGGLALASLLGGVLASHVGDRPALLVAVGLMTASALGLGLSPFVHARMSDGDEVA
jgi:MFS family permease